MIDIIIPVFRGFAATRRAVESALASRSAEPHELVVIDDASPEPRIGRWLDALAAAGRIRLLRHEMNRGFVASVNEGMRLHADRDVLLLNSDTEVADGWIDRIAGCARRGERIASVTPFSNNATICSYPRFAQLNRLPAGETTAGLDRLFARENAGLAIEIPTAVGFCMFIARAALEDVGLFDEEAFGLGYGEEVDFCMRAARAGYRHRLCADAFVFHEGEVSFGGSGAERRAKAQALVDARYPEFQVSLRQFLGEEPARPLRRRVDIARLAASPRPRVLFASAAGGSTVERHIRGLAEWHSAELEALWLQGLDGAPARLQWLREGEEFEASLDLAADWEGCIALLRRIGIGEVELQRTPGMPAALAALPGALGVQGIVTVHQAD